MIGGVLAYLVWQFFQKGKEGASRISAALDKTAEEQGYLNSEGQNDPTVRYVSARIAFAKAAGYQPGSLAWMSPPGFPDKETWLKQNPAPSKSWVASFLDNL